MKKLGLYNNIKSTIMRTYIYISGPKPQTRKSFTVTSKNGNGTQDISKHPSKWQLKLMRPFDFQSVDVYNQFEAAKKKRHA